MSDPIYEQQRYPSIWTNVLTEVIPCMFGWVVFIIAPILPSYGCLDTEIFNSLGIYLMSVSGILPIYSMFTFLIPYVVNACFSRQDPLAYLMTMTVPFIFMMTSSYILHDQVVCASNARWILVLLSTLIGFAKAVFYILYFHFNKPRRIDNEIEI
jgi:hypothetical protein